MQNPLREFFYQNTEGPAIHKWEHYFDIYHRHFSSFQDKPIRILEFGIGQGGSLRMWKNYFGKQAQIFGVDIDPACKALEDDGIQIFIGDQEDRAFLRSIRDIVKTVDIVIEDGGHTMRQQIATFEEIYPMVNESGVFLIEDLHTSYWPGFYEGGYLRKTTFIEYSKRLIDQLNAWHTRSPSQFKVDNFTSSTRSMHFYDSVVVFEKGCVKKPVSLSMGVNTLSSDFSWKPKHGLIKKVFKKMRRLYEKMRWE